MENGGRQVDIYCKYSTAGCDDEDCKYSVHEEPQRCITENWINIHSYYFNIIYSSFLFECHIFFCSGTYTA